MSNAPVQGQGASTGATALAGEPPVTTPAEWTSRLPDDLKGHAQLKGWKTEADVVKSYVELEKFRGVPAERLLTLPDKEDSPDWAAVHARLGRPEKPEDYGIEVGDPEYAAVLAKTMHELGLSKKAAQGVIKADAEFRAARLKAEEEKFQAQDKHEYEELRREWGQGADAQIELGRRFARQMGLDQEALVRMNEALGTKALLKFMAKAGSSLGEHQFKGGGNPSMGYTPEAAKAKIAELKADKAWSQRYLEGGSTSAEFKELQSLLRYANG